MDGWEMIQYILSIFGFFGLFSGVMSCWEGTIQRTPNDLKKAIGTKSIWDLTHVRQNLRFRGKLLGEDHPSSQPWFISFFQGFYTFRDSWWLNYQPI